MTTRDGEPLVVFYLLMDLSHAGIAQARSDLRSLHRRLRGDLELGVNTNDAKTRAIVKVALRPVHLDEAIDWFQSKSWKGAVLQRRRETALEEVRQLVRSPDWSSG